MFIYCVLYFQWTDLVDLTKKVIEASVLEDVCVGFGMQPNPPREYQ